MSLAVWLGDDRKCSAAVVGLDLLLGLSVVRRCSLNQCYILNAIYIYYYVLIKSMLYINAQDNHSKFTVVA